MRKDIYMDPKDIARLITEDPDVQSDVMAQIYEILAKAYGDSPAIQKLLRPKPEYTNPGERHTGEIIRKELEYGSRLVGNPWKEDVQEGSLDGLYTIDYGRSLLVSLPENSDVAELVAHSGNDTATHLVRGLAFGYEPESVLEYYNMNTSTDRMEKRLKELGVVLSTDVSNDGFDTTFRNGRLDVVVEPDYRPTIENVADKIGKIVGVSRWCPECQHYVRVPDNAIEDEDMTIAAGRITFNPENICHHKVKQDLSKPSLERHWFIYDIDVDV